PLVRRRAHPREVVARRARAHLRQVETVGARRVLAEDPRLHARRQLRIAEALAHLRGYLERAERVERWLRRAVPDRVGAPEHAVLADGEQQLAEHVRRLFGAPDQAEPGGAELGPHVRAGTDAGAAQRGGESGRAVAGGRSRARSL